MGRNSREYRESSMETKMTIQFKKLVFEPLAELVKIVGVYVIDDNRYIFHVLNKMVEQFYIVNGDNCFEIEIQKKSLNHEKKNSMVYFCHIGKGNYVFIDLYFNAKNEEKNHMIFNEKKLYNKLDSYLYDLFFDIFRMKNSE